jgi:hypothetical protein
MLSLILLLAACSGATPPAPAPSPLDALPIAQYLGHDDKTGERAHALLAAAGIESSAGGSLGYSVWIAGAERAKARQILLAAATNECLDITVFDDQAVPIKNTRPARCGSATPPAPVDTSNK